MNLKCITMKVNYLFPSKFKKIGWLIFVPSVIIGLFILVLDFEPEFLTFSVFSIYVDEFFGDNHFFGFAENNLLNEIIGILVIISSLLVAFSKEKVEDEFISKIRLESLVWAVYVNYGILLISFLLVYDFSFLWIMIFNMFTVLLFFIIRFHWQISRLKNLTGHEE